MMDTYRILLVEDNAADAYLTREALESAPFPVEIVISSNGVEALDRLYQRDGYEGETLPDLVILDLNLPRLDGREVLARIKGDQRLRRIPVVIMSSSEAQTDISESYDAGANCYLTKPLDFEDYESMIRALEGFWFSVVKLPPSDGNRAAPSGLNRSPGEPGG